MAMAPTALRSGDGAKFSGQFSRFAVEVGKGFVPQIYFAAAGFAAAGMFIVPDALSFRAKATIHGNRNGDQVRVLLRVTKKYGLLRSLRDGEISQVVYFKGYLNFGGEKRWKFMSNEQDALATLIAKEAIRELGLLYSRGVDRKDAALLRTLYTKDATDTHGNTFDGKADDYVGFLERAFPYMAYSGHHVCNHLISVDGNEGDGEIYAIAYHIIPDGKGGWLEDLMCVRYIDRYRKEEDERWRFAKRVVTYDMRTRRSIAALDPSTASTDDPSYIELTSRLFARGDRA